MTLYDAISLALPIELDCEAKLAAVAWIEQGGTLEGHLDKRGLLDPARQFSLTELEIALLKKAAKKAARNGGGKE